MGVPKYRFTMGGGRSRRKGRRGGVGPLPHGAREEEDKGGQGSRLIGEKHHPLKGRGMAEHSFIHGTGAKFKKGMEWCHLYHDSS
jgi:hypothetical protein